MHLTFRNVNDGFRGLVHRFHQPDYFANQGFFAPTRSPSRNGEVLVIQEPVTITYTHPMERVLFNQARDANPFALLYESLWMLAGRNDVAPLAYYTKQFREYSDDGVTLNGAYGYRWRSALCHRAMHRPYSAPYEVDQLKVIIDHLKADPNSRRAVLSMWNVEDDLLKIGKDPCPSCRERDGTPTIAPDIRYHDWSKGGRVPDCGLCKGTGYSPGSKDVCCNLNVMFSVREDGCYPNGDPRGVPCKVLDITVTNRSNDLIWGLLGANYVCFSVLQEYVAAHLGVEVGRYHHFTNNLHAYSWNWKPEEWLLWYDKAGSNDYPQWDEYHDYTCGMHNPHGPDRPMSIIPLVRNPEAFDREIIHIVNQFDGNPERTMHTEYTEPFLRNVALPMFAAHKAHKEKDREGVLRWCKAIQADDWRIACTNWITRRQKS